MKKLLEKDKKLREKILKVEKQYFILNSIYKNFNFFTLVRWNAFLKLKNISNNNYKTSLSNRCLATINRKRFNKFTTFSRQIFLNNVRFGKFYGIRKSSW
nr:ribosomal protein S14 [Schizostauron trachyderma]